MNEWRSPPFIHFSFIFHLYFIHYCSLCVCNLFIRATNTGRWPDVRSVASLLPCNSLCYVLNCMKLYGVKLFTSVFMRILSYFNSF